MTVRIQKNIRQLPGYKAHLRILNYNLRFINIGKAGSKQALFVLALPTTAPWLKVCTALRLPPEMIRFSGLPSRVQSFFEYWKLLSVFLRCAADLVQRN